MSGLSAITYLSVIHNGTKKSEHNSWEIDGRRVPVYTVQLAAKVPSNNALLFTLILPDFSFCAFNKQCDSLNIKPKVT
jgi:hypothetical protein